MISVLEPNWKEVAEQGVRTGLLKLPTNGTDRRGHYPHFEADRRDMALADEARKKYKQIINRVNARRWRWFGGEEARRYHREHMRQWREGRKQKGLERV